MQDPVGPSPAPRNQCTATAYPTVGGDETIDRFLRRGIDPVDMGQNCVNCGAPDTARYELMVRNTTHEGVPLCEECHEAISDELAEA